MPADVIREVMRETGSRGGRAFAAARTPGELAAVGHHATTTRWARHRAAVAQALAAGLPPPSPWRKQKRPADAQPGATAAPSAPVPAAGQAAVDLLVLDWLAAYEREFRRGYVAVQADGDAARALVERAGIGELAHLGPALRRYMATQKRAKAPATLADFAARAADFLAVGG